MKNKTYFVCQNCGYRSARWQGKCPSCGAWNSFTEEVNVPQKKLKSKTFEKPVLISQIDKSEIRRLNTQIEEFNRVLGGGIVPGSVILLGGDPGIGKSTLLLQVCSKFSTSDCLYISGEESQQQIALRFGRINSNNSDLIIYTETNLEAILETLEGNKFKIVVVDSIQSIYSSEIDGVAGSILQIRECASKLTDYAKKNQTSIILIGHITKEGNLAGPKVLEHIVDVVLQFEGDRHYSYRIIRTLKNRFGSTNEIGIFEMTSNGLVEVKNPSEILIQNVISTPGVAISCVIEGTRPLLVETQALVSNSNYSYPQRNSNGYDMRRLQLILAVLEKKLGLTFGNKDVFVNIAGGFKIEDTAIDLAVALALISSYYEIQIPQKAVIIGEVGLTGEIRPVSFLELRINETTKLGLQQIILPKMNSSIDKNKSFKPIFVDNLKNAFEKVFKTIERN